MAIEAIEESLTHITLKLARVQLGLPQTELARRAGVHRTTIKNCEQGGFIRLDTAWKILNALNAERQRQLKSRLKIEQLTWNIRE
jgi:DNA-binding XRE family transcriptional regulator